VVAADRATCTTVLPRERCGKRWSSAEPHLVSTRGLCRSSKADGWRCCTPAEFSLDDVVRNAFRAPFSTPAGEDRVGVSVGLVVAT